MESIDSPDIAPEKVEAAKAELLSHYTGHDSCLRPDEVDRPPQQFFSGADEGCGYEHLVLARGKMTASMACQQESGTHHIEVGGTYTPDSYSIRNTNVLESSEGGRRVSFTLLTKAHRSGEC